MNFPILADPDRKVSNLYDMIHPNANDTLTVRSVFIIDPKKKIRLMITYPASTGRNFDEILRVIDSLQLTDNHSVATPVNWKQGEDVIIVPSLQDPELIKQKFPKGYKARQAVPAHHAAARSLKPTPRAGGGGWGGGEGEAKRRKRGARGGGRGARCRRLWRSGFIPFSLMRSWWVPSIRAAGTAA